MFSDIKNRAKTLNQMQRKKLLYWMVQLIGWTTYFLFSVLLLYSTKELELTFNLFAFATLSILASIFVSHGIRYIIIRYELINKSIIQLIFITLFMAVSGAFLLETVQYGFEDFISIDYVVNMPEDPIFDWPNFLFAVSRSIILFLLWCGFYYAFIISEKSRAQEILTLKWEASKNEIELKNLRAQLNPHFLFNSLNSIRALIGLNPDQAKMSVTQLSTLLRRSINLGKMRVIPLKEELDLVKIYLDLEQVRFEERLRTEFQIDGGALSSEIPPLMIQTIVENGIKHGISQSIEGGVIRVKAEKKENVLILIIANSGRLDLDQNAKGIGISNTKKRLEILYDQNAAFDIRQINDEVVVTIKIVYK